MSRRVEGQEYSVQGESNQQLSNPGRALYLVSKSTIFSRTRERVIPPSTSSGSSSSDEEVEEERAVSSRGRVRRPNPRLFD